MSPKAAGPKAAGPQAAARALRVVLAPDGSQWFAQGLEWDYAAAGNSPEDAERRFESGLAATLRANPDPGAPFRKTAPQDAWDLWLARPGGFGSVRFRPRAEGRLGRLEFPFSGIAYLEAAPRAAPA